MATAPTTGSGGTTTYLLAGIVLVLATSCSSPTEERASTGDPETFVVTPTAVVTPEESASPTQRAVTQIDCSSGALCAIEVAPLAEGSIGGSGATVHAIEGVDPATALTVGIPSGDCGENDPLERPGEFSFAFATFAPADSVQEAACIAGNFAAAQRAANNCHLIDGSELASCGAGPTFPRTAIDDLEDYYPVAFALSEASQELLNEGSPGNEGQWHLIVSAPEPNGEFDHHLVLRSRDDGIEFAVLTDVGVVAPPQLCAIQAP